MPAFGARARVLFEQDRNQTTRLMKRDGKVLGGKGSPSARA